MQITSINANGKENLHVPNSCSKWTPMKTTLQRLITRWMAPACRHGNVNRRQVLWFSVKKVRRRAPTSSSLQDHYHYHGWKPSHITPNMKCRIIPVFRHFLKTSSFTKDHKHIRAFSNRAFRITIPTISQLQLSYGWGQMVRLQK